jgi:peptidoglycan/LPS O-acetylase OafA/YrhL
VIDGDSRSRGEGRVGRADHPRLTYQPELDGLRGIGVLLVLVGHTYLLGFDKAGREGVTLFFALSGYLITRLLLEERAAAGRISLRAFYERRVRRLLPAMIAVVVVTGGLMAALGQWSTYPAQATATLLYVGNLAYAGGFDLGYLSHTWSLAVEEQFYLVWPALVILVASRRGLISIAIAGILLANVMRLITDPTPTVGFRTDLRIDAVLVGCLLALVPMRVPRWAGAGALLFVLGAAVWHPPFELTLVSASSAIAVIGASGIRVLAWRPLVRVGELSYGLYLWHMAPALLLAPLTQAGNLVAIAIVWVAAFVLALVSERWIERRWRRRRVHHAAVTAADPQGLPLPSPG